MPESGQARGTKTDKEPSQSLDAQQMRSDLEAYEALLGLHCANLAEAVRKVETGLPYRALRRFQRQLAISLAQLAALIHMSERTLARRRKTQRLSQEESDRLLRAARIFGRAGDLFEGDLEAARRWAGTQSPALGGATPLEFAGTEIGAREVENLIGRLEHGVFS